MFTYGLCFEFDGEDELSECCKHLVNTYERMKSGLDAKTHHVNVYTSAKVIRTPTGPNVKIEVSGLANAIRLFEEQKKNAEEILQGLRACLKSFDKNGGVGDNRKKQAGAGENASIPK